MLLKLVTTVTILAVFITVCRTEVPEKWDSTCVKDPSKVKDKEKPTSENYMDCLSEEAVKEERTRCCAVGDSIGCCKKAGDTAEQGRMLKIAMGIIGVSIGLAIIVYIFTWCDRATWPCIARIDDCCTRHQYKLEEKMCCCQERVERRRLEEEHRKKYSQELGGDMEMNEMDSEEEYVTMESEHPSRTNNVKLDAPEEFKAKVQDSFF